MLQVIISTELILCNIKAMVLTMIKHVEFFSISIQLQAMH